MACNQQCQTNVLTRSEAFVLLFLFQKRSNIFVFQQNPGSKRNVFKKYQKIFGQIPFVLVRFQKFLETTKSFVLSLRNPGAILNVLVSFRYHFLKTKRSELVKKCEKMPKSLHSSRGYWNTNFLLVLQLCKGGGGYRKTKFRLVLQLCKRGGGGIGRQNFALFSSFVRKVGSPLCFAQRRMHSNSPAASETAQL